MMIAEDPFDVDDGELAPDVVNGALVPDVDGGETGLNDFVQTGVKVLGGIVV